MNFNMKERLKKIKKDSYALYIALKSPKTPIISKVLAALTICYLLSPIDLIPDFIPVLGYLDDIIILPILVSLTVKTIPSKLMEEFRKESEYLWKDGKPKSWKYAIPILILYGVILIWIIKKFLK